MGARSSLLLVVFGVSGACGLGYELVWMRLLNQLSPDALRSIVASFASVFEHAHAFERFSIWRWSAAPMLSCSSRAPSLGGWLIPA